MRFAIHVEDVSGKKVLETIVPKIIGPEHSFSIKSYKGIGRIPKNQNNPKDARRRLLLNHLPALLAGHGKTFANRPDDSPAVVIIVCDLDNKRLKDFRNELIEVLRNCAHQPETRFCIAIEEGEAWLLGDLNAIRKAYPKAKEDVLEKYRPDSICGTWELLADAISPGGAEGLKKQGWHMAGRAKSEWALKIPPHMDVSQNASPSFNYFRDRLLELADQTPGGAQ